MNYQYFGLFLDEPTRNKLMQVIIGNPIICNLVFQRGSTIYLDHCTLLHKNQHEEKMANDLQYRIDGNFRLIVNKIGISADKSKFSIEEFSKAVERFNNPIPKPIVDDEDNCTVEERKALNEYYEYRRHNFHSLSYFYVSSDIKFANLSVGDDFYGEEIIAIDKKLGIVVTKENNEVNYYWVKDPNSKPSLYRRGTYNSLVL